MRKPGRVPLGEKESRREIILDGEWLIVFDPRNEGRRAEWHALPAPPSNAAPISVPSCWETINPGYDGVAWYWRKFKAPQQPRNGAMILQFDAANYFTEVWINGRYAGRNEGGYTPFQLDVTDLVNGGEEQTLVARVLAPPRDEVGIDGIVLKEIPCWRQWESFNFGGIWQSVRLFNLPAVHIADCFVQPDADLRGVSADVAICSRVAAEDVKLQFELYSWSDANRRVLAQGRQTCGRQDEGPRNVRVHLSIDQPECWSPESPHLYLLKVRSAARVERETIADELSVRFGLRWFTLRDGHFHLNGERIFVKGGFHEGLYPIGLAAPPSREFVLSELRKAKQAGFNLLRYWQIPIHPTILDVADEVGMMLCDEPPIEWMLQTEKTVRLCEEEVRRMVLRDRNRPSVVLWTILNEAGVWWGKGGPVAEELAQSHIQKARDGLCHVARRFDPTRIIIDDSGGWVRRATAYLPGSDEGVPINDVHTYRPAPTSEEILSQYRSLGEREGRLGVATRSNVDAGAPVFVSEFGYGGVPDLARVVRQYEEAGGRGLEDYEHHKALLESLQEGFRKYEMRRFFDSADDMCLATQEIQAEGNYLQAVALRANPLATGYVLHAFSAGGCIIGAETFDMWRNEKAVARSIAEANRPCLLSVFLSATSVEGRAPVRAEVVLANEGKARPSQPLRLSLKSSDGNRSEIPLGDVDAPPAVTKLWSGDLPLGAAPGQYELEFLLGGPGEPWAKGRRRVWVLPPRRKTLGAPFAVIGGERREAMLKNLMEGGAPCTDDVNKASQIILIMEGGGHKSLREVRNLASAGKRLIVLVSGQGQAIKQALDTFEIPAETRPSRGSWYPVSHYANNPALLDGLPGDRVLGQAYAEIMPVFCVVPFQPDTIAGCFSCWQPTCRNKPTEFWWGSTILEHQLGGGSVVLCTFRLAEQANHPEARRMLLNLLALK